MTPEAMAYLNEALDYIQEYSVMRDRIDWSTLRQEAYDMVADAQNSAETYPAIKHALERLGDRHSHLTEPVQDQQITTGMYNFVGIYALYPEGVIGAIHPGSPAEAAGVQVGDRIESINHQPVAQLTQSQFRASLWSSPLDLTLSDDGKRGTYSVHLEATPISLWIPPRGQRLASGIGYLDLPSHTGTSEQNATYAVTVQNIIREVDTHPICGWVVDLRRNTGGHLWPMLAGVGPIVGEGTCIYFVYPDKRTAGSYRKGQALGEFAEEFTEVHEPYELKHAGPPTAVLTSPLTASSGEFIALAFCERSHSRSFGEPTRGVPTSNESKVLSDGARVILTTALGANRTGQSYDSPLLPDQHVKIDWRQLGTSQDPVLQAALEWLQLETGCM